MASKRAIVIGASSGIGRALAKELSMNGYSLGLVARREDKLLLLQKELPTPSSVLALDIQKTDDVLLRLNKFMEELSPVNLVIINAGIGYFNEELDVSKELDTIDTNVIGFTVAANVAYKYFSKSKSGHIVGISSICAIRGGAVAPAYNASKAFISNYMQGLKYKSADESANIIVTDIQPGYVDTKMAQGDKVFWVATPEKAAKQIYNAILNKRSHAYVSKRWRLFAWLMKCLPDRLYRQF